MLTVSVSNGASAHVELFTATYFWCLFLSNIFEERLINERKWAEWTLTQCSNYPFNLFHTTTWFRRHSQFWKFFRNWTSIQNGRYLNQMSGQQYFKFDRNVMLLSNLIQNAIVDSLWVTIYFRHFYLSKYNLSSNEEEQMEQMIIIKINLGWTVAFRCVQVGHLLFCRNGFIHRIYLGMMSWHHSQGSWGAQLL